MGAVNVLEDLKTVFHANTGQSLSDEQAWRVLRALVSVRDTAKQVRRLPRHLFQVVFENKQFYKAVYPCDILELRRIFEDQSIHSVSGIPLFSMSAAKRLIRDYPCLLILNLDPQRLGRGAANECIVAGGLAVCDTPCLDISGKISGIIVQDNSPFDIVERIVANTIPECPIYGHDFIPGIERDKFAAAEEKKYVVNLPALAVRNVVIRAKDEEEAVAKALARRWNRHPDSKEQKKPERYTPEFWQNSGFWESIVREADTQKVMKMSQNNQPQINLTPDEELVFQTILAIDQEFGLGQQYRVAGGWVRDRLLGMPSDDIDIALDKMTGQQFLQYAREYKRRHPESPIGKDYVVQANADKSKHLETTALEIGPFKIDFVNLRTENYAEGSRVPTMEFGTPEVDAQRRDLTINAMFYNIGTRQVEDYVGGLQDLQSMTLRTPLDPVQTFMDDPLRMLRVLRFNSRYPNAQIAPEVVEAMSRPEVHEAYRTKVAPERAGPEIVKMFGGEKPQESLAILYDTGMDRAVMNLPELQALHPFNMDQRNPHHEFDVREHTFRVMDAYNQMLKAQEAAGVISKKDRILGMIAAWWHDIGKLHPDIGKPKEDNPNHWQYIGHEDKSADLAELWLKHIGVGRDDREFVTTIVREHMMPHNDVWNKRMMGKLRERSTIPGQTRNDVWKFIMWHAKADDAAKGGMIDPQSQAQYDQRFDQTNEYMNAPPPVKPLIDGGTLIQMFPTLDPKSGFIREVHRRLLDEQNAGNVLDVPQAQQFVETIRPQIEATFMKKADNWYSRSKQADASSGAGPEGYNAGPDSNPAKDREQGVKHMIYYPPGGNSQWVIGDTVRGRRGGLVDKPQTGTVVDKKGRKLKVRWNETGETQTLDVDDIETMASIERA